MNALLFIPHKVPMASVTLYQTATIQYKVTYIHTYIPYPWDLC